MGALLVRHEPSSAALVRERLRSDLERAGVATASIDEAVLVTSELLGNAIRHTEPVSDRELSVRWDVDAASVTVSVADASQARPIMRNSEIDSIGGRGLRIVAALADRWGVEPTAGGKRVWAHVPVHAQSWRAS